MDDKAVNKWLRRRFSPVGWTLVGYFLLMNALVIVAVAAEGARQNLRVIAGLADSIDPDAIFLSGGGYIAAVAAGLVILYGWKGPDWFRDRILVRRERMKAGSFLSLIAIGMLAQILNGLWVAGLEAVMNCFDRSVMEMLEQVSGSTDSLSMFLYASVLAPISEEILFRGYVMRSLEPFGKRFALFGSALMFGLFHGNLLQTPYAFIMGLVLGYAAMEYSIVWAIGIHIFNNLVLADAMSRLQLMLPEAAAAAVDGVYFLIAASAVVLLIRRRREIREYRAEGMDPRCVRCFLLSPGVIAIMLIAAVSMAMTL